MTKRSSVMLGGAVLAGLIYVAMWVGWTTPWGWLDDVDTSTLAAAHRIGVDHHAWVTSWDVVCTVFSPLVLRILAAGVIVYAFVRRRHRVAWFLLLCAVLSGPLTEFAKWLADRPRPSTAMVYAPSSSFPSGHALGVMACVLALSVVAWPHVRPRLRPLVIAVGAVIVVAVGVGRVALNVHHASDVLAGWSLGYVWFVVCLPVLTGGSGTPVARGTER